MKRTYACARLLEHGALCLPELVEITGWTVNSVKASLLNLQMTGHVTTVVKRRCRRAVNYVLVKPVTPCNAYAGGAQ